MTRQGSRAPTVSPTARGPRILLGARRRVEERELIGRRSFDLRRPAFDVFNGDGSARLRAFAITGGDPAPELAGLRVEEAQLGGGAEFTCAFAQRVALVPAPGAPLDDHDGPQFEQPLPHAPLELLDPSARKCVERVDPKFGQPIVGGETNCAQFALELESERGLARRGQPRDDDEPAPL